MNKRLEEHSKGEIDYEEEEDNDDCDPYDPYDLTYKFRPYDPYDPSNKFLLYDPCDPSNKEKRKKALEDPKQNTTPHTKDAALLLAKRFVCEFVFEMIDKGSFCPPEHGWPEFVDHLTQKVAQEVMAKQVGPAPTTKGAQTHPEKEHTPLVAPVSRNESCVALAPVSRFTAEESMETKRPRKRVRLLKTAMSPPSPTKPPVVNFERADLPKRSVVSRPGFGTSGNRIPLLTNLFKVSISNPDEVFHQYSVSICNENSSAVENKALGRKIIDKLCQTYSSDLAGKKFAYDGEKILYTVGPLPKKRFQFTVVLEDSFATKRGSPSEPISFHSKTFSIVISYAAKIPLKPISLSLQGGEPEKAQDSLRVLDTILRQQAANRGCLLVRQSFFHDDPQRFTDVGGDVTSVRGFHSSFRPTLGGLSLNMDVSTTMILKPGPVVDFLLANQHVEEARKIDWAKAGKMLKNMRIKASHRNREFKIIGLSEKSCYQQLFSMRVKNGGRAREDVETMEISVYDYFVKHRNILIESSAFLPCLDVGKPKRPIYLPLELCSLVSLQRYTKALSSAQRACVEKSRLKPPERIRVVNDAVNNFRYDEEPLLVACGVSIENQLTQIEGRVLVAPKLKVGNGEDCIPQNGRWNFNNKKLLNPTKIEHWALVNFSACFFMPDIARGLMSCGRNKGMQIEVPKAIFEEDPQSRIASPVARVEKMFELMKNTLSGPPLFLLCVLPEPKNSDLYGPWKKKCLASFGVVTQCISPIRITEQYLTNVLLKMNTKLGGTNSLLAKEQTRSIPLITDEPTMILGMDVSHGPPGHSNFPSIAAVVGSLSWPLISRYRAAVRTQSSKVMIESMFKPLANGDDDGIMRELLLDFYKTSNGRKPTQIIIFRAGVNESQFAQVLNIELDQIIKACQHLETDVPKFTVVVAQKSHHTRLFQASDSENVPPGTVVDTKVVHPRYYDFYLCSHTGLLGTSRPAHYHVLMDEIGFPPDDLQNLIYSLSYVNQRSTTAVSIVAPVYYAHLAAQQMSQFLKFEDLFETSFEEKGKTASGSNFVPELPRLDCRVAGSMFFC